MQSGVLAIGLGHYLTVGAILLMLGVFGIFLNRKNVIVILMSVELILLVAMIGAIVLTHRQREGTLRQNITAQQTRAVADTLEITNPRSGAGIAELGIYRPKPAASPEHEDEHADAHGHGGGH